MSADRRSFLKLFGITAAAIPVVSVKGESVEVVRDETVKPLATPNQPREAFHGTTYQPCMMDVQRAQLYSAIEISSGEPSSRWSAFHYGLGQSTDRLIHGATIAETNMCMAHCLPAPEAFCVQRVGVLFSPVCDPAERSSFIDHHALEMWIANKVYWRSPLADIFAVGNRASESQFNPEFPVKAMANLEPLPLILESRMYFKAELSGSGFYPESPLRMWVVYDGMHARGVQ